MSQLILAIKPGRDNDWRTIAAINGKVAGAEIYQIPWIYEMKEFLKHENPDAKFGIFNLEEMPETLDEAYMNNAPDLSEDIEYLLLSGIASYGEGN